MKKEKMSRDAASRIQAAACKQGDGTTPKNSFAARAMRAAYKNEPRLYEKLNHDSEKSNASFCCKFGIFSVTLATSAAAAYYICRRLAP